MTKKQKGQNKKDIIQTGQNIKLVLSFDFLLESQAQHFQYQNIHFVVFVFCHCQAQPKVQTKASAFG